MRITSEENKSVISVKKAHANVFVHQYQKAFFLPSGTFGAPPKGTIRVTCLTGRNRKARDWAGYLQKIMENLGGMIKVQSEPDKGLVFTCYFPLH